MDKVMKMGGANIWEPGVLGPGGLSPLYGLGWKNRGKIDQPRNLAEVCVEVEGMFLSQLLEQLRKSMVRSLNTQSAWLQQYQSLTDQHVARALAKGGGLGLARQLYEALAPRLSENHKERPHGTATPDSGGGESGSAGDCPVP